MVELTKPVWAGPAIPVTWKYKHVQYCISIPASSRAPFRGVGRPLLLQYRMPAGIRYRYGIIPVAASIAIMHVVCGKFGHCSVLRNIIEAPALHHQKLGSVQFSTKSSTRHHRNICLKTK